MKMCISNIGTTHRRAYVLKETIYKQRDEQQREVKKKKHLAKWTDHNNSGHTTRINCVVLNLLWSYFVMFCRTRCSLTLCMFCCSIWARRLFIEHEYVMLWHRSQKNHYKSPSIVFSSISSLVQSADKHPRVIIDIYNTHLDFNLHSKFS